MFVQETTRWEKGPRLKPGHLPSLMAELYKNSSKGYRREGNVSQMF